MSALFLLAGCAPSPEETEQEKKYYEKIYADEPQAKGDIAKLLKILDNCVGGQYIFGGQGNRVTRKFIEKVYQQYPAYFSGGRMDYLQTIADEAEKSGWDFPESYSWDCSGLWWYAANELNLYGKPVDRTAHATYKDYCTPVEKEELRPGDLVFVEDGKGRIAHMGVVGRHGYIYEAVSGFCGVVLKRTIDKRVYRNLLNGGVYTAASWNKFGRPKVFE